MPKCDRRLRRSRRRYRRPRAGGPYRTGKAVFSLVIRHRNLAFKRGEESAAHLKRIGWSIGTASNYCTAQRHALKWNERCFTQARSTPAEEILVNQDERMSGHEMLGFTRRPMLDIVDQLIGKELHGPVRGPRDMRREDEIRAPHVEQRVTILWRLDGQHVEAGAGDQPLAERLNQRRLIDQSAAGGVDEQGLALHFSQRMDVDQIARRRQERTVQRDHM